MRLRGIVVLAVLVAGCGGSDERDSGGGAAEREPAKTLAAAEWSAQVEEMCDELATRSERKGAAIGRKARSREEAAVRVFEMSVEMTEPYVERMADLPPPEGREKEATRFLALMRRSLALFGDIADGIKQKDPRYVKGMTEELREVALESRGLARDLDIQDCIPPGSSVT